LLALSTFIVTVNPEHSEEEDESGPVPLSLFSANPCPIVSVEKGSPGNGHLFASLFFFIISFVHFSLFFNSFFFNLFFPSTFNFSKSFVFFLYPQNHQRQPSTTTSSFSGHNFPRFNCNSNFSSSTLAHFYQSEQHQQRSASTTVCP